MRPRFVCSECGDPIRKSIDEHTLRTDVTYENGQASQIERITHNRCIPNHAPPDSPLNAAVQKAKQAIADAQRLTEREQEAFREIVGLALTEQRQEPV